MSWQFQISALESSGDESYEYTPKVIEIMAMVPNDPFGVNPNVRKRQKRALRMGQKQEPERTSQD